MKKTMIQYIDQVEHFQLSMLFELESCMVATICFLCSWSSTTRLLNVVLQHINMHKQSVTVITTDNMQWGPADVIQVSIINHQYKRSVAPFFWEHLWLLCKVCWVVSLAIVAMDNAETESSICSRWWSWMLVVESVLLDHGDTFRSEFLGRTLLYPSSCYTILSRFWHDCIPTAPNMYIQMLNTRQEDSRHAQKSVFIFS